MSEIEVIKDIIIFLSCKCKEVVPAYFLFYMRHLWLIFLLFLDVLFCSEKCMCCAIKT